MSSSRKLDQFYTREVVAEECFNYLNKYLAQTMDRGFDRAVFVEPSAGQGAFFKLLPEDSRVGIDLDPKHPEVQMGDFLECTAKDLSNSMAKPIIVIGNPPFGKNSSLALKFMNHSAQFAEIVAFILPRTFKKQSTVRKIDRHMHLLGELELAADSFEFEGSTYDVPCVFQIWGHKDEPRIDFELPLEHQDFQFTTPENANFAIRRVGALAGKVIEDYWQYSPASHYYIKARGSVAVCKNIFGSIDWNSVKHNTAGNPSISKRELVALYSQKQVMA